MTATATPTRSPRPTVPPPRRQRYGVVSVPGKLLACLGMAAGYLLLSLSPAPWWLLFLLAPAELGIALYLLSRPSRPGQAVADWWPALLRPHHVALLLSVGSHALLLAYWLYRGPTPAAVPPPTPGTVLTMVAAQAPSMPLQPQRAATPRTDAATRRTHAPSTARPLLHGTRAAAFQTHADATRSPAVATPPDAPPPPEPAKAAATAPPAQAAAPYTPAAAPAAHSADGGSNSWESRVLARLERFRRYPATAHLRREEGVVYLRARINRDGQVLAIAVARSSGHPALDAAALDTVARAQPLPRIPAERADELEISLPVEFFLD